MAFATSSTKLSSNGDMWRFTGTWTGSAGDASGTVSVGGASIASAAFWIGDSNSAEDRPVPTSWSTDTTTGITTVTVHNHNDVTTGAFEITYR